ncbi:MAG: hypothetical protein J5I62_00570 [Flavobacteriales bacterium]|nr:hypothetical protein [Flavobacteriales bacterium]MEB2342433.1 hypothetical protein [Flavobacteriia bacterium]
MPKENNSIETLISVSGTLASISLALVAIISAKATLGKVQTFIDDVYLFSALGFLFVVVLGYLAQKHADRSYSSNLVRAVEWIFSLALFGVILGGMMMVYTSL